MKTIFTIVLIVVSLVKSFAANPESCGISESTSDTSTQRNDGKVRMARYGVIDDLYYGVDSRNVADKNKSAGFYLERSAIFKGIAIGSGLVSGILGGTLISSDSQNTRTIGYATSGVFAVASIGLYIASIVCESNAGKMLDIEMRAIHAKIGMADTGTGVKVTF